jgi:hypothetical protein
MLISWSAGGSQGAGEGAVITGFSHSSDRTSEMAERHRVSGELQASAFAVAPVVALLLSAPRLRRSPPALPTNWPVSSLSLLSGQFAQKTRQKPLDVSGRGGKVPTKTGVSTASCPSPSIRSRQTFAKKTRTGHCLRWYCEIKIPALSLQRTQGEGRGTPFPSLCATAATLPALLPTNWPVSSLSLLSGQFAQRTRQKPLDVSGRGGKVATNTRVSTASCPSPSISSRQILAKKARTGHCLRWYCEIKIPALSLQRTQGEGRGTPLIFSFSSCLTRGVHFSGQFAQRTESKASGQECPLHTIQVWFVDWGVRGL